MLRDDIQTLDYFVKFYNGPNRVDNEWERIKKYCYEALNTANNIRSMQLRQEIKEVDYRPQQHTCGKRCTQILTPSL